MDDRLKECRGLLLSAALLAAACFLMPEVLAATLTVDNTDDSGAGSLRNTILIASGGDEIVFDPSLAGRPTILTSGEIIIDKDLVITGLGRRLTIVSGPAARPPYDGPEQRLFAVRPGVNVSLIGLSLTRGSTLHSGGAAILNEGNVTLRDCELSDNFSAIASGAAIYNRGNLVLLNTTLYNNRVEDHGSGAGLFNSGQGRVQARGTLFSHNSTPYEGGAAILNAGFVDAEECEISRNHTFRSPGAIANYGTFHLRRSVVQNNYALYGGGAAGNGGLLVVVESTFVNNTIGMRVGIGGGISNYGTLVLTNSTVQGNGVDDAGGHGGGIQNSVSGTVRLTNSTLTGNYLGGTDYGGAAGLENAGTAVIRGGLLAGNYSTSDCYNYPRPPLYPVRSDLKGLVVSHGRNFVGGCTDLEGSTCTESVACSGFGGQDFLNIEIGELVESETVRSWLGADNPPQCGKVAFNGGPTPTVAVLPGSAIIDSIPLNECIDESGDPLLTDQRGTSRPQGTSCDAGSFEYSPPRGSGFWAHQCSGRGYSQLTSAEMQELFDRVAQMSPAFPECTPIGCDTLRLSTPRNDLREKAQRGLLGLWLNLITGRVTRGRPIELPALTTTTHAGEALAEVERVICDPSASRGELGTAKDLAEAINNEGEDMELVSLEPSSTIPSGATRSFSLSVVNMSSNTRSYDLSIAAPWPAALSLTRINGVGPGQIAMLTTTLSVPAGSRVRNGEIRVTATDRNSELPLARSAGIQIQVLDPTGSDGGGEIRRVVK